MRSLRITVVALGAAALVILSPLWGPALLAAWTADVAQPLARSLRRALGGRRRAAGALVVAVAIAVLTPVAALVLALVGSARELVDQIAQALARDDSIGKLLGDAGRPLDARAALDLLGRHGADAWRVIGSVASASAGVALGAIVFVATLYALTTDGRAAYAWLARHAPIDRRALARLVAAFRETGRGLLLGMGSTAVAQGAIATAAYASLGVHRAVTLGVLTGACSFVPGIGTMLVWGPVAAALATLGHPVRAIVLVGVGLGVIGTIDNVLRPWLARVGRLRLPVVVVFLSMLGGLRLVGGWGLLLGPLVVRLAVEGLAVARERRLFADARAAASTSPSPRARAHDRPLRAAP